MMDHSRTAEGHEYCTGVASSCQVTQSGSLPTRYSEPGIERAILAMVFAPRLSVPACVKVGGQPPELPWAHAPSSRFAPASALTPAQLRPQSRPNQ